MSGIQLMHRAVKGVPAITVTIINSFAFCTSAGSSNVGIRLNNDGTLDTQDNCGSFSFDQNYLSVGGGSEGDAFEVMCSVDSFTGPNGGLAIDTWFALTSSRQWNWTGFNEFNNGIWRIDVREIAAPGNNGDAVFDWEVEDGS